MARGALRIAIHEARRYFALFNKNLLPLLFAVLALAFIAGPRILDEGIHPDEGLYRVEVSPGSPFLEVARSDPTFHVTEGFGAAYGVGKADLLITGGRLVYDPSNDKSLAALEQLKVATRRWLESSLAREEDGAAAFPVRVNLVYQPRSIAQPSEPTPMPGATSTASATATPSASSELVASEGDRYLDLRPDQVDPPFPLGSLLLTFAYLIPLNFLSQYYATNLYAERVRQRGILLLSTPHSGPEILLGKTLPYLVTALVLSAIITVVIGSDALGFLAVLPIIAFALASAMLIALVARSPREVTFLLVAATVLLSTFLFLPAIFTDVHPVAFLSPVTVLAQTIRDQPVGLGSFLYATLPLFIAGMALWAVSAALYKEEELFAPKNVLRKLADGLYALTRTRRGLLVSAATLVPFAIGAEVFVLIFAVSLNLRSAFAAFLIGSAIVEELLKFLLLAGRLRDGGTGRTTIMAGLIVGCGFFLGEKIALMFSLLGLDQLPLGQQALASFGISVVPLLLLGPLVLHVVTSMVSAFGITRGRAAGAAALAASVALHVVYNLLVIWTLLGVGG